MLDPIRLQSQDAEFRRVHRHHVRRLISEDFYDGTCNAAGILLR